MSAMGPSTFDRARRKKAYRRLAAAVRNDDTQELVPLEEVTRRLRLFDQTYVGVRTIPVDRIVGTVDRARDFDRDFLPRRPHMAERWKRVERTFPEGDFPPIVVYELDGQYFLVDGHHRVAIAKQRRVEYIDAEVTRLRTRYPLPSTVDVGQIIYTEQQRLFLEESGLERTRPEARIEFSNPQGYQELLEQIKVHGFHLMREWGKVVSTEEVAGDWYDHLYLPAVEVIRREGLLELFPDATEADLFLWISQRRRSMFPERGGITFEEAARLTREGESTVTPTVKMRRTVQRLKPTQRGRRGQRGETEPPPTRPT